MRRMMMGAALALLGGGSLGAQGGTEVWVATFSERGSAIAIGAPVNVTKRAGYDNQPQFTADGSGVYFTSIREDAQADIWHVALSDLATRRLTGAPESEYSATPMPDGSGFSVIRVEQDSTQRLWAFDLAGAPRRIILPSLKPVGYHVWIGETAIGAFVLGSPNALVLADPRTERVDTLARGIGRAFARVPGRDAFTFIHMHGDTAVVGEVDVRTKTVRRLAVAPEGGEYHIWTPGGRLIITAGSRLYVWTDGRWDVVADLAAYGLRGLSRIAISPTGDRIAVVATEPRAP
jgi:hypothetical protein